MLLSTSPLIAEKAEGHHARQHVGEIKRREQLREPSRFDCKASPGTVRGPLALKRERRCVAKNYDEIDSLSAQQAGHSQYAKTYPGPFAMAEPGVFIAKL